jgi:hypothetical protein
MTGKSDSTTFRDYLATVVSDEEFESALGERTLPRDLTIPDWIYEHQESELDLARSVYESQRRGSVVDIAAFFDDLRMKAPVCDRLPGIPVWQLLPFFNHVVVWLEPFRTAEAFEKMYGLSPRDFVEYCGTLREPGKIIPILNAPPTAFAALPHFEPILRLRPPTHFRDLFFQRALAGPEAFGAYRDEARELVLGALGDPNRFASLRDVGRGDLRDLAMTSFVQIAAFGGRALARGVVQHAASAEHLVDLLFYYSLILYDSHVSPLGGTYPCERAQMEQLTSGLLAPTNGAVETLPVEFGRVLSSELSLPVPVDSSVRAFWTRELEDEWSPVRDELAELEAVLGGDSAVQPTGDLAETWSQVARELSGARSAKSSVRWGHAGVGVMGKVGAGFGELPGMLATASGMRLGASVFEIESVYSRIAHPRHLACVLDLDPDAAGRKGRLGG